MSEDLMTYEEVAEHLGIKPASVRSTMRRYGITEQRGYPRGQVMALERKPRGRPAGEKDPGRDTRTDPQTSKEQQP